MDTSSIEIDLSLLNASKNVDVSSILEKQSPSYKQEAIKHIGDKYPDYIYIYTDGSRIPIGRAGASVFIPDHDIELYYRLPDNLSAFTAELDAVYSAISLIIQHKILKPLILTDSLRLVRCLGDLAPVFLSRTDPLLSIIGH